MKIPIYYQPSREPPPGLKAPPWPPPPRGDITAQNNQNKIQKSEQPESTMKKDRKKQEDRLLKHLSLRDRQRQVQLRQQIAQDPLFLVV
jgi:hypothetical protein